MLSELTHCLASTQLIQGHDSADSGSKQRLDDEKECAMAITLTKGTNFAQTATVHTIPTPAQSGHSPNCFDAH